MKNKYNELLQRYKKAEIYFSNVEEIPEKHLIALQELVREMNDLLVAIKVFTDDEVLNGFK